MTGRVTRKSFGLSEFCFWNGRIEAKSIRCGLHLRISQAEGFVKMRMRTGDTIRIARIGADLIGRFVGSAEDDFVKIVILQLESGRRYQLRLLNRTGLDRIKPDSTDVFAEDWVFDAEIREDK